MKVSNIKYLLVIMVAFFSYDKASCQEDQFKINYLFGKWNSYKVTTLEGGDGSDVTFDGKPFRKKLSMNFIDSAKMFFSINGSKQVEIKYLLKNNVINIGHKKYKIIKLNKTKLVLKEEKLLGNLIYLEKNNN